jgi:hypothetical protein
MATELVIGEHNWWQHATNPTVDGEVKERGLIPRDYSKYPRGCYSAAEAVDIKLIDRADFPAIIKDKEDQKSRLSDIRLYAAPGQQSIPSLDQNGQGYCWAYSTGSAITLLRAVSHLPYVRLSPHAVACKIKNFRDEGGWGPLSLQFAMDTGYPTVEVWPEKSMSRSNDKPEVWANAALHKVTEAWVDLATDIYDRNLTFDQVITLLLNDRPVVVDFNWWSHSVCAMDAVNGAAQWGLYRAESGKLPDRKAFDLVWGMEDPVTAGFGIRIWNSWTDSWSDKGTGILTGSKAVPNGAVGPRITTAA